MGRAIAIANQKGGVGKSTTAINLSSCLGAMGQKVLTIDLDPQGNTTSGLGVDKDETENTVYELLLGECEVEDCLQKLEFEGVSLIPSNVNLAGAEIELISIEDKEYILQNKISKIRDQFDFIIIDCPLHPSHACSSQPWSCSCLWAGPSPCGITFPFSSFNKCMSYSFLSFPPVGDMTIFCQLCFIILLFPMVFNRIYAKYL